MSLTSSFQQEGFRLYPQVPTWNPDFWDTPLLRCYGYSLQDKRLGDCVLGSLPCILESAPPDDWFTVEKLRKMASWDGLIETDFSPGQNYGHIIALTFGLRGAHDSAEYHFYLYHPSEGFWSHKPGAARPSNKDSSRNIILDPRSADLGTCDVFAGFFTLPAGGHCRPAPGQPIKGVRNAPSFHTSLTPGQALLPLTPLSPQTTLRKCPEPTTHA